MLARAEDGETAVFPVAENSHADGILDITIAPARIPDALAARRRNIATRLAVALDYVGVLAVEFFVVGGKLLFNEIAPAARTTAAITPSTHAARRSSNSRCAFWPGCPWATPASIRRR